MEMNEKRDLYKPDLTRITGNQFKYALAVFDISYKKFADFCKKSKTTISRWANCKIIPERASLYLRKNIGDDQLLEQYLRSFNENKTATQINKIKGARAGFKKYE